MLPRPFKLGTSRKWLACDIKNRAACKEKAYPPLPPPPPIKTNTLEHVTTDIFLIENISQLKVLSPENRGR
jgi:hypothetical protein